MSFANLLEAVLTGVGSDSGRIEHFLDHWARAAPHDVAAIEGEARISFRGLGEATDRIAGRLISAGIAPGDCVAVLAPPSIDFLASFLAVLKAGATWLGVNPKYTRAEIHHLLEDASPKLLMARKRIHERDYVDDIVAFAPSRPAEVSPFAVWWLEPEPAAAISPAMLGDTTEDIEPFPVAAVRSPSEIAAYVYTSGSTGQPKAARLSHRALIRGARVRAKAWPVSPLRLINNLPINHVGCLGDVACTALIAGGSQVFLDRFSAAGTLRAIDQHGVTYWYQAPTMFEMCLAAPEANDTNWSSLQAAIWSGGRPSDALLGRMAAISPMLAMDYSMTESVGPITMTPLWDSAVAHDGSVGWPDPGRQLRIGDGCGDAQTGEVMINDEWMFSGYRRPEGAIDAFSSDGWFRTGDLAARDANGRWRLVGRSKEMFKSGGYNVYPREIEMAIESHPAVSSAVVVEAPDPLYGEVGIAFVVAPNGRVTVEALRAYCRERLANYKVPKQFEFMDALPMLAIGKVDKVALRRRLQPR